MNKLTTLLLLSALGVSTVAVAQDDFVPSAPTGDTVSDIETLMDVPIAAKLREYEEDIMNPKGAFTPDVLQRLLGTEPRFIYFAEGVDPMIIPWVRDRIVAEELFAEAQVAITNRDYDRAESLLRRIREEFANTLPGQSAPGELNRVSQLRAAEQAGNRPREVVAPPPTAEQITLPLWIAENTTAVLITGSTPVVIVGNDFLREGDSVPRYSSVRVKTIGESEVVYTYQNLDFPVEVRGSF